MTFRAVLFDLDGTLLNSIDGIVECFEMVLAQFRPEHAFTRHDMIMKIGEPVPKQMLEFSGDQPLLVEPMVKKYRALMSERLSSFPLYEGSKETLTTLKAKGYLTGLVTSKSRGPTEVSLNRHDFHGLLDVIVTADDTLVHKPLPEPLFYAAGQIGVATKEILFIGDSIHDINCAHAAGAAAGAAYWGPFPRVTLDALKPRFGFETLPDIPLKLADLALSK